MDVLAHSGKLISSCDACKIPSRDRASRYSGGMWLPALGLTPIELQTPNWHEICSHTYCGLLGRMPYPLT